MTIDGKIIEEVFLKFNIIRDISFSENLKSLIKEYQEYLTLYEKLCNQVFFKCKKPNTFISKNNEIAQQIYYNTLQDYEKKGIDFAYYRGNCSAFYIVMRNLIDRLQKDSLQKSASIKLRGLIEKYIHDSLRVINHYQESKGKRQLFPVYQTNNPDYSLYYDTCQQIIFGEVEFENPSDQSEVTPALIRVMIELRLKWSMGISGYMNGEIFIFIQEFAHTLG